MITIEDLFDIRDISSAQKASTPPSPILVCRIGTPDPSGSWAGAGDLIGLNPATSSRGAMIICEWMAAEINRRWPVANAMWTIEAGPNASFGLWLRPTSPTWCGTRPNDPTTLGDLLQTINVARDAGAIRHNADSLHNVDIVGPHTRGAITPPFMEAVNSVLDVAGRVNATPRLPSLLSVTKTSSQEFDPFLWKMIFGLQIHDAAVNYTFAAAEDSGDQAHKMAWIAIRLWKIARSLSTNIETERRRKTEDVLRNLLDKKITFKEARSHIMR